MPLYSSFSFSLNNRACQQLAKLLLLWRRKEEVIEWGSVRLLKPFFVQVTWPRLSRGYVRVSSPLSFPWFQYFLTICDMYVCMYVCMYACMYVCCCCCLLFLRFSVLVANPKKTTLHGGQSRSWSAEQEKENKRKSLAACPPPPPSTLLVRRK